MNPTDYSEFVIQPELVSHNDLRSDALDSATKEHYRNINVQIAEAYLAGCTAVDIVQTTVDGAPSTRVIVHWREDVTDDARDVVDPRTMVEGEPGHVERYDLDELPMKKFDEFMQNSDIEFFELEPFKLVTGQK